MPSPKKFVVLAAPRTGSNLLCTMLNSHPEVLCHHEIFNPGGIFLALDHRNSGLDFGTMAERDRNPLKFLESVWNRPMGAKAVGFKWTRGQNQTILEEVVGDSQVVKFLLRRRNRVKTYISEVLAEKTEQWEVYQGESLVPRPRVNIKAADLYAHAERNERMYGEICSSIVGPVVELTYEALVRGDKLEEPLARLGVSTAGFNPRGAGIKQNPSDLRKLIGNFQELEESLDGAFLEELRAVEP